MHSGEKAYDILGIYDFPDNFDALNGLHSYLYTNSDIVVEALASQKYDLARDIVTAIETVDKDGSYDDCAFYVSRDGIRILRTAEELIDALVPKGFYPSNVHVKHPHGLTLEQIKRLPELLERPVVLMDSDRDDTMVAVLADVDGDGLPLIAALRPGANAVSGGRCVPGTIVCSVYGKPESYFLHKMQQMPQRVLYQDIEKGRELDARAKLQLFGGNIASPDLDRKIIRLPECIVKLQAGSAPTEAARVQQESRDMASGSHALGAARPAFGTPAMNRPIDSNLE